MWTNRFIYEIILKQNSCNFFFVLFFAFQLAILENIQTHRWVLVYESINESIFFFCIFRLFSFSFTTNLFLFKSLKMSLIIMPTCSELIREQYSNFESFSFESISYLNLVFVLCVRTNNVYSWKITVLNLYYLFALFRFVNLLFWTTVDFRLGSYVELNSLINHIHILIFIFI